MKTEEEVKLMMARIEGRLEGGSDSYTDGIKLETLKWVMGGMDNSRINLVESGLDTIHEDCPLPCGHTPKEHDSAIAAQSVSEAREKWVKVASEAHQAGVDVGKRKCYKRFSSG